MFKDLFTYEVTLKEGESVGRFGLLLGVTAVYTAWLCLVGQSVASLSAF